ncbi:MAG TPA: outer membrane protein transport protein [Pseudolabrys sp.]|jgi:long-chain fatty acid transport protein
MSFRSLKSVLLACSGAAVLLVATTAANAGGFAVREQSAAGQGASFAGMAAGGPLSSMFWNPATMTQYAGKAFEGDITGIFPKANQTATTSALSVFGSGASNTGDAAAVPASYSSIQLNDKLWIGMSVNSPFGLSVSAPALWAGAGYMQNSSVRTLNASPSIAYKINDMISVAAGVQIQWMSVNYGQLTSAVPFNTLQIGGSGYGYGFTLGTTITPMVGTTIGIGYRSSINQKIDGTLSTSNTLPATTTGSVNTNLKLPDQLSIGLRQRFTDRWTFLAGFEFANWARIGTATINQGSGAPATLGGNAITLPFQYSNSYFYSAGFEYAALPNLTLRTGIGYEKSPITDGVRTPRLPDNDRMWYSIGATYLAPFKGLSFDVGYSYIDVKNTPINISAASGNPWLNTSGTYIGDVKSNIHIFSVAMRYQWDNGEPVRTSKLITK